MSGKTALSLLVAARDFLTELRAAVEALHKCRIDSGWRSAELPQREQDIGGDPSSIRKRKKLKHAQLGLAGLAAQITERAEVRQAFQAVGDEPTAVQQALFDYAAAEPPSEPFARIAAAHLHTGQDEREADGLIARIHSALAPIETAVATGGVPTTGEQAKSWADSKAPLPEIAVEGMMTVKDLAERFGLEAEPLRKRLDRWRAKNALSGEWIENKEATSRTPHFLYRVGAVMPVIDALRASGEASDDRPAKKKPGRGAR